VKKKKKMEREKEKSWKQGRRAIVSFCVLVVSLILEKRETV